MSASEFTSLGQTVERRVDALRLAVKWCDWPGAQASTVVETARIFEYYLTSGNPPFDSGEGPEGVTMTDVDDPEHG